VINNYASEINVKIVGGIFGGCDIVLKPSEVNDASCQCYWTPKKYAFCAYSKNPPPPIPPITDGAIHDDEMVYGQCPEVPGEKGVCNDLSSIGYCHDSNHKGFVCTIDSDGLCHCQH
jgi:hypothetical protein